MSDNQERLALEWAKRIKSVPREYHDEMYHAVADIVLAHIKPPTMEDVEWDHEEHYLAGATHEDCTEVIMHSRVDATEIATIRPGDDDHDGRDWSDKLFPNGKRYKLVELPDPPEVLETREDYENAPRGTVVVSLDCGMWTKSRYGGWLSGRSTRDNGAMAEYDCTVLRWGDEE